MVDTPTSVGAYQRLMAAAWDERAMVGVPVLFQSIFGRPESGGRTIYSDDAEVLDIDIIRANGERHAVLVPRGGIVRSLGSGLKATHEQKLTNVNRVYPLSVELYDIYSSQLNRRLAGEPLYAPYSREQRLRTLATIGMRETVKRTVRMFEILASQSARTGQQDGIIGETTPSYDWSRAAGNTITPTITWDGVGATILADIDSACDAVRQNGHMRADVILVGADAMAAAVANEDFQTIADNRRFGFIVLGDQPLPSRYQWIVDAGADARGWILTPKGRRLWVFTYDEGYTSAAGAYTPYLPVDECLVFSTDARADRCFGPPETLPADTAMRRFYADRFGLDLASMPMDLRIRDEGVISPRMFHFDAYGNSDHTTITHRTQSAPIFAPTHVDSFARIDGCV